MVMVQKGKLPEEAVLDVIQFLPIWAGHGRLLHLALFALLFKIFPSSLRSCCEWALDALHGGWPFHSLVDCFGDHLRKVCLGCDTFVEVATHLLLHTASGIFVL